MFGVVVNYFATENYPPSVKQSAKFAVSLLKNCQEVTSIVLVDGSDNPDIELKNYCEHLGIIYGHSGERMSFGEAYNYGVGMLKEDWIALMASDIYVYPYTFSEFRNFIDKYPNLRIGCLIPYLTRCDLPIQQSYQFSQKDDCYASIMTLNLNVFKKDVFEKVGGINTKYTGNFNDIDLALKLKEIGCDIFLVAGASSVVHYGRLTLQHGSSVDGNYDYKQFYDDHPEMYLSGGFWNLSIDKFIRHPILKFLYRLNARFGRNPENKKQRLAWVLRQVPALQKIK